MKQLGEIKFREYMTEQMARRGFQHLPVDADGEPIGLSATTDLARALAERGALLPA